MNKPMTVEEARRKNAALAREVGRDELEMALETVVRLFNLLQLAGIVERVPETEDACPRPDPQSN